MNEEIKPCPFPLESDVAPPYILEGVRGVHGRTVRTYQIACDCGYRGVEMMTKENAIAAHNRVSEAVRRMEKLDNGFAYWEVLP